MGVLKNKAFWGGVIVGYAFLVLFPQYNIRTRTRG